MPKKKNKKQKEAKREKTRILEADGTDWPPGMKYKFQAKWTKKDYEHYEAEKKH